MTRDEYQQEKLEESDLRVPSWRRCARTRVDQLSGGERRRTEIARCLAIDPKFIMLDEPFAGVSTLSPWKIYSRSSMETEI
jgi:lipopolysaccharide export system ATP-binding protein